MSEGQFLLVSVGARLRSRALHGVAAWTALAVSVGLFCWYYLAIRQAFFDDVYIYLHVARNAIEHGSWQYFVLSDRAALLASSPLKVLILTGVAGAAEVSGFDERSLVVAKVILVLGGVVSWAIWYPFWRKRARAFAWMGVVYFLCALGLDAVVDFEGGLLYCWIATLAIILGDKESRSRSLGWVLPLGLFIRPDLAVVVIAATLALVGRSRVRDVVLECLKRGAVIAGVWVGASLTMGVHPIPVTWWAKAAMPHLVENQYMIQMLFERIGWATGFRVIGSASIATLVGVLMVIGFILATVTSEQRRWAAFVVLILGGAILARQPASFWWYYQSAVMVMLGVTVGLLAREQWGGWVPPSGVRSIGGFAVAVIALVIVGKAFLDGPNQWRLDAPSRAGGYQYLASKALGNGLYDLPGIGSVIIKNPEIGMTSYFSGEAAWIWDSAGLAQPLDHENVRRSKLRHFYPNRLHEPARPEALRLFGAIVPSVRVVDVWAMEDRNFDAARKKCRYVIEEGAICANDFAVLRPDAAQ